MKRKQILLLSLLSSSIVYGQIGVNTEIPKSTLHILPTKFDGSTAEGIIAPNLTRAQLITKDAKYTTAEKGSIVYVTDLSGTLTTKTAKITQVGYYYFDGSLWQQFATSSAGIPSEPWRVQGSTTEATSNTEDIYQAGKVTIGIAQTSSVKNETLYVKGKSLFSDDVVVGTSGSVYPTNYAMHVFGSGSLGGLWVEKRANLKESVSIGENLTAVDDALIVSKGKTTLNGATTIAGTGSFTLQGNGAGANKYLKSDASGNATWSALPAATVTTANNGLSMSGTTTQLGGALAKATTISGTGANTLTISAPAIVSGSLQISSGTPGANKYLKSDASGNATWSALPAATVTTANNGLSMSGTTTQLGGALAKATTISGTGANTLTLSVPTRIGTSTALFNSSAQLELADANKGFLPNRVALTSSTVKAPITNAVDGMIVYNTTSSAAQNLSPGFYYWRGTNWQRLVDEIPVTGVRMYYQTQSYEAGPASGGVFDKMNRLYFSDQGVTNSPTPIILQEGGSYAINIKLFTNYAGKTGQTFVPPTGPFMGTVYVGVWINNVLQDVSEVFPVILPRNKPGTPLQRASSNNVVLGCTGEAGDEIVIKMGYFINDLPTQNTFWSMGSTYPTAQSARTTLIYWKL